MDKLKIAMTPELKNKLQGFLPMREDATVTFKSEVYDTLNIPEDIKEQIVPTITIRQWNNKEIIKVKEQSANDSKRIKDQTDKIKVPDQRAILWKLVKDAVVDIENLYDNELESIDWKTEYNLIPMAIIVEIFNKLYTISGMEQETIANMLNLLKKKQDAISITNKVKADSEEA